MSSNNKIYHVNNRSPSSNLKKNNQNNFITRKLHQSLKKNHNYHYNSNGSDLYQKQKYDFIKTYQSRHINSKQCLKRPVTNHYNRSNEL